MKHPVIAFNASSRLLIALAILITMVTGCERDEPTLPEDVIFKFEVTEALLKSRDNYIAIISNFNGNVLVIDYLNYAGTHELVVPRRNDDVFHLTLYDGSQFFITYAAVEPGTYLFDFKDNNQFYNDAGKHSIVLDNHLIEGTGQNIYFTERKTSSEVDVWLSKETSDLYLYCENITSKTRGYIYVPVIGINQASTFSAADRNSFNQLPVTITNPSGTNIFLSADNDADDRMKYFISHSGPFGEGTHSINVPPAGKPNVSYFKTVFASLNGPTYTSVGKSVATTQKQLTTNAQSIETTAFSLSYSIISDATLIDWDGSGVNFEWRVLSPPGTNMKINLPQFPQTFKNNYNLEALGTLAFSKARLLKDTRYPSYAEEMRQHFFMDKNSEAKEYELLEQTILVR